jgi:hypothetical protein
LVKLRAIRVSIVLLIAVAASAPVMSNPAIFFDFSRLPCYKCPLFSRIQ